MTKSSQKSFSGKFTVVDDKILYSKIISLREEFISRIDPVDFLEYIGAENIRVSAREIRCKCPIHDGRNPNSLSVKIINLGGNKDFRWKCYSNGCHEEHGSDIIGLLMAKEEITFPDAVRHLISYAGMSDDEFTGIVNVHYSEDEINSRNELSKICAELSRYREIRPNIESVHAYMSEEFIERSFERRNQYFINRGISEHVLNVFEVGHCSPPDSPWAFSAHKSRAVIPIRSEDFKLVGVSGRAIDKEIAKKDSKFRFLPGSDRYNILYGLYLSRPYIEEKRSVIIVEGFADLWKCWMAGYKNVVAVMGKKLTDVQTDKILKLCHRAFICFDYDQGRNDENVRDIADGLSSFINVEYGFVDKEKDLGESSVEEIRNFFEKYPKYT